MVTYATRAAEIGVNPKILQLLLGHSEISTTLKYYTHISKATLSEAAEIIIAEYLEKGIRGHDLIE